MPTSYTSLLGLALPVTGELSGTWGDTVNNYITSYVDASVAGTQTISTDGNVTLTVTNGTSLGSTSAQYMILNCTGARTAARTITVPASSRHYVVINGTTGGFAVNVVGAGPTTGVSVANGERCVIAWNGSDYVKVASSLLTALTGTLSVANGGTGQTSYTDGQLLIGNSTGNTLAKSTLTAGSGVTITNGSGTITIAATATGDVTAAGNNAFTGANTFYNSTGQTFGTGTSTQDGIILAGRAGGSSSYRVTLQPGTLSASRTVTLPDANTTIPVASQVITFSGPTAARTYTLPDSASTLAALATAQTFTATQTFSGSTSALAMVLSDAAEVATISATAATGTINYDVTTQSVLYYTSNASANWTVNFRASSGTSLNTAMSTGQSVTVAFLVTQGSTAYYNSAVQVDGSSVTPKYQGGTAWTAGNASSIDAYVYTIVKTGSAAFTVFASQTQFK